MKSNLVSAILLCGLMCLTGVASAADPKPRQTRGRADEVLTELTDTGRNLEAKYEQKRSAIKAEIEAALPTIDARDKAALLAALKAEAVPAQEVWTKAKALDKLRGKEGVVRFLQEQLKYAPQMVADFEGQLQRALALPDDDAGKAKAVESAQKRLDLRKKEADALPGQIEKAQTETQQAKAELPQAIMDYDAAVKALDRARDQTRRLLDTMSLEPHLAGGKLDTQLVTLLILTEESPRYLAQFAQRGPEREKLVDQLLSDTPLMMQMLIADGAYWGKYAEAMAIYTAIQKASPRANEGVFQRLALAVALEHAVPMTQNNPVAATGDPVFIDPVKRYLSYEKWYLDGELDPTFKDQSVWNLRMVVDGGCPDAIYVWGRQMLRNYRPDMTTHDGDTGRYVNVVDAEVQYGSGDVKYDKPELQFMQNILANGGICGRRAFFGRFILRSFGVPTVARPEPGHATLACWEPGGWQTYLGGHWGGRDPFSDKGPRIGSLGRDLNFLQITRAREDPRGFMKVKRAQWIGDLAGEKPVYGSCATDDPGFWYGVSLIEQQRVIDGLNGVSSPNARQAATAAPQVAIPEAERMATVDRSGVITIPAAACSKPTHSTKNLFKGSFREAITFMPSNLGGMQLHYSRYAQESDTFEYTFDAPKGGKYQLTARVVTPDWDQSLYVQANGGKEVEMPLPYTLGMWQATQPVVVELVKGKNTLTLRGPAKVAVRDFILTPL
ncbi:MAG: hypothetical protein GC164_06120 [Phycisphaera sp.]|nr:hypothetical protein [Phycisphaera sp.]